MHSKNLIETNSLIPETVEPFILLKGAHAGSGKTRSIFNHVKASGKRTIIATPTNSLSEQYETHFNADELPEHYHDYFKAEGVRSVLISRKRNPDRSSSQHLKDAIKAGARLIFVNVDVLHESKVDTSGYEIFIDEIPEIVTFLTFDKAQYLRPILKDLVAVKTSVSTRYYELTITPTAIDLAAHGWEYAGIKDMKDVQKLCERIDSRHYVVLVLAESYHAYMDGKSNDIDFWTILQPSVYDLKNPPIIVGANAEDRLMHKIWGKQIAFHEPACIVTDYDDLKHKKDVVRILYVSNKKLTGEEFDKIGRQRIADLTADKIGIDFPGRRHIFGMNPKRFSKKNFAWKHEGITGTRVQLVPHGQNGFKNIDMAVYLAAQYHHPATYTMLQAVYGISGDEVTRDFTYERLYQFIMRTNARVKAAEGEPEEETVVIVPDKASAEYLSERFGGAEIEFYDIGEPALHEEDKFTQTPEQRREKRKELMAASREKERMIKEDHENTHQYDGIQFIAWASKEGKEIATAKGSWFDLGAYLEKDAKTYEPRSKSASKMFREGNLADFDSHKLRGNILSTKLLILDIDKVKRDPMDLSDYLYQSGISHYIFNTFSSTPMEPRIRVVIGLSEAVNGANFNRIFKLLQADIQVKFGDAYEIDAETSGSINSRFFAPCVSKFGASLFIERHVMEDDFSYKPKFLDVRWFLSRNQVDEKPKNVVSMVSAAKIVDRETIDMIIDKWAVAPGLGLGLKHFRMAAVDLKKAGCSYGDVIQILTESRHRFGHGQDRDAKSVADYVFDTSPMAA